MNPDAVTDSIDIETLSGIISPSGYQFDPQDGKKCRENFVEIEKYYLDTKGKYAEDVVELKQLYTDIVAAIESAIPRFVMQDHEEFIYWAATHRVHKTVDKETEEE